MPELDQKTYQRRHVAYKVRICDIIKGNLVADGLYTGYIIINELNVSRANIIATVVYKSESRNYSSVIVDDGTARINLKTFENNDIFSKIDVGDAVLVIGKIREFNNEKYIMPEILKKIVNTAWANLRRIELEKNSISNIKAQESLSTYNAQTELNDEIYALIKKLDFGDGVSIDDVIKVSNKNYSEQTIKKLLENGEIFEIKPGKLKVLE